MKVKVVAMMSVLACISMIMVLFVPSTVIAGIEQTSINNSGIHETISLVERDYIYIGSDVEFNSTNGVSSGNGTENNPYIIENWIINGTDEGYCIIIELTSSYCTIRNCVLYDARDNIESSGITLYECENIVVDNCTINNNDIGIMGYLLSNVEIMNCHLDGNGYESGGGGGEILFTGIDISSSENVTICNNHIINDFTDSIRIYNCENCIVDNNYVANGTQDGIVFTRSIYCIISNNYVADCLNGISAIGGAGIDEAVEYNIVYNNTIIANREKGIFLINTENNTFYFNSIIANNGNVIEFNSVLFNGGWYSNIWYTDYGGTNVGNYYSDYTGVDINGDGIGEEPYNIYDEYNNNTNNDLYPLISPSTGTLPEQVPMTWSEIIVYMLLALMPVVIIIMIMKKVFESFDKGLKTKKR